MERRRKPCLLHFLSLILLCVFQPFRALLVLAQSQKGFISVDCGYVGSSYEDSTTGLTHTDDSRYIERGENNIVSSNPFSRQYRTLRSFPDGIRNCYKLSPVQSGVKYVIRAGFYYGNYDGEGLSPVFDLHIGVNFWTTVEMGSDGGSLEEIITVSMGEVIQVCLVNTGNGTPFISELELRPLPDSMYPLANESRSLVNQARRNYGTQGQLRYPDDPYDRVWYGVTGAFLLINTTREVEVEAGDAFQVPSKVLRTAISYARSNLGMTINPGRASPGERIHVVMHFAEFLELNSTESREMDIYGGDSQILLFRSYSPPFLKADHKEIKNVVLGSSGFYNLSIYATNTSTLSYMINALESFIVRPMNESQTDDHDVSAIQDVKKAFGLTRNWDGDPCSPRQYAWIGVNCSYRDSEPARIISLNLSSSRLDGEIPSSIAKLTALKSLDISANNLKGLIPDSLGNLSSLQYLNLSGNEALGVLPRSICERASKRDLSISIDGRLNKCEKSPSTKKKIIFSALAAVSITIIVLLAVSFWIFKRKRKTHSSRGVSHGKKKSRTKAKEEKYGKTENETYTYDEIKQITQNFLYEIGKGGFGAVYLGHLGDGNKVAVKVLSSSSSQGNREFEAEIQLLTRVHHKNLVTLIGYCDDAQHLSLVYEYLDNGTLRDHLRGEISKVNPLNWSQRVSIALHAAQGLDYLHNGCRPPIVHRDIKCTNILLTRDFVAKIADFGLSRAFKSDNCTHITTRVAGTPGYLDPQDFQNYGLNEKSDVYSFGVVLLEIITGQPPYLESMEKTHIIQRVSLKVQSGDVTSIIDPSLRGHFDFSVAWNIIEVAMSCTSPNAEERITMSNVVVKLKECLEMDGSEHALNDANSSYFNDAFPFGLDVQFTPSAR